MKHEWAINMSTLFVVLVRTFVSLAIFFFHETLFIDYKIVKKRIIEGEKQRKKWTNKNVVRCVAVIFFQRYES